MGDCQKVVDILELIIDKEATDEQKEFFNSHVEGCAPCLQHYEMDEAMLVFLKQTLEKKKCCDDLLSNIKSEINKIQ